MQNRANTKIIFGSWKAYNDNLTDRAFGSKWLDMSDYDTPEDVYEEMHNEGFTDEELEETFIQDFESDIDNLFRDCDNVNVEDAMRILEMVDDSDNEIEAINAYLEEVSDNIDEACDAELYWHDGSTLADICEEYTRECHEIPDYLDAYIDWDAMARDWSFDGNWYESSDGVLEIS